MSSFQRVGFPSFFNSFSAGTSDRLLEELDQFFDNQFRMDMIEEQLLARGLRAEKVIQSMLDVPRHRFLPSSYTYSAYDDVSIPLGYQRSVHPPYLTALMMEAADIQPQDRVLEVGTGCGYTTALLSRFRPQQLISIEEVEEFVEDSVSLLKKLGFGEDERLAVMELADLSEGFPPAAPYDAVIVNPPIFNNLPPALFRQVAANGRLIAPIIHEDGLQTLSRFTRMGDDVWVEEILFEQRNPVHVNNNHEHDD